MHVKMLKPLLLLLAALVLVAYLFKETYYRRLKQHAAFPQAKPSLIWGHMLTLHEAMTRGFPAQHFGKLCSCDHRCAMASGLTNTEDLTAMEIHKSIGRPPVMLMDLRPLSWALLIIANHEVAEQITRASKLLPWSAPKSPAAQLWPWVLGHRSILGMEGEEWKALRKMFNPGFAHSHLMTLMPLILDKTWQFIGHLNSYARTDEDFPLGDLLTNLTFDIIGAVTMDVDLGAQLGRSDQTEFIQVYRELVEAYFETDDLIQDPRIRFRRRRLGKKMNKLLTDLVKRKLEDYRLLGPGNKSRSVLALSLADVQTVTPDLLQLIVDQIKTFLFAGHDTTSTTLQWALYELSRTPRALKTLCSELNDIFGEDPSPAVVRDALLSGGEETMRRMSYTSAVIKEVLRLYPPAATGRMVPPGTGFRLRMPDDGRELCIDGMVLYNCETIIQRDPDVYGETADVFVPERWLGDTDTSIDTNGEMGPGAKTGSPVPASAWRPFERGPRNCIGQELANIEARVILA